jgi:dihydroflavonol-4-reductase
MRVFVTGGNGFIGSVVVRHLLSRGHDVVCLLRETSRTDRLVGLDVTRARGDVRDGISLQRAIRGCDCTIHLAAPGGWSADDPTMLREVIVGGTRNVLAAAAGLQAHRVVVVSSVVAIGATDEPRLLDERTEFVLRDRTMHYAHAKHDAELLVHGAVARGSPVIIVNPAEVYGPGDTDLATAGNLVDFATATPVLVCHGGTSVVHVDDVAAGIVAALARGRVGERYILGGDNLTIRELARLVLRIVGRRRPIVRVPNGLARVASRAAAAWHIPLPFNPYVVPYATRFWFVDNSKARRELGVQFRGARDVIAPTIEWLTRQGELALSAEGDHRPTAH